MRDYSEWKYDTFSYRGHTAIAAGRDDGVPLSYSVTLDDDPREYDLRDYAEASEPSQRAEFRAWWQAAAARLIRQTMPSRR